MSKRKRKGRDTKLQERLTRDAIRARPDIDPEEFREMQQEKLREMEAIYANGNDRDGEDDAHIVLCSYPPGHFPDNVLTTCCGCGTLITHRPYVPAHFWKICRRCAEAGLEPWRKQ